MYLWSALLLSAGTAGLLVSVRPSREADVWLNRLDVCLAAILAAILLQLVPLPAALVAVLSPARAAFTSSAALSAETPALQTLALDWRAVAHAWLGVFPAIAAFWVARAVFERGGIRAVITALAWTAVVLVLLALAQGAAGTHLVYGFWQPYDGGARPFGPFINRNHFGTWAVMAFFLCLGCLQWRRGSVAPSRGWSWRARLAHALDGRSMVLALAMLLLAISVALGASRSTMLALAAGAGYVAATAPKHHGTRRGTLWTAALALAALLAVLAYADLDRLMSRVDETRQLGLSQRTAIWRDTLGVIRAFPLAGAGAGNFSIAMRLYQTSDRTYFWNEAHNHYLQVPAEGGLLIALPAAGAIVALAVAVLAALRRKDDPLHWLRLGASAALVAVAVQSLWETGLTLPANGMLAGVAAAMATLPHAVRPGVPGHEERH